MRGSWGPKGTLKWGQICECETEKLFRVCGIRYWEKETAE